MPTVRTPRVPQVRLPRSVARAAAFALALLGAFPGAASQYFDPQVRNPWAVGGTRGPGPLRLRTQDEDPQNEGMRNTALLKLHPVLDQLVVRTTSLVAEGRYAEALAIFEESLEQHPDSLVPLDPERAVSVRDYVHSRILLWPEEGQALHRRRVDPLAEHAFEAAKRLGDADALEHVAEQYPFSSHADDALAAAAALRFDAGQDERAADLLERLLDLPSDIPESLTMARLGLALSRAGRKSRVEDLARRAARGPANARVQVGGQETKLGAHLAALAKGTREGRPPPPPLQVPSWETIGGAPSGAGLAESGVGLGPLAWGLSIGVSRYDADDDFGMRRGSALALTPGFRPLFPVVSDGILYVHNENVLYALSFASREPELLWQFVAPERGGGAVMFDDRLTYTTSVSEGRVFANLLTAVDSPEDRLSYVRVKFPFPRRALFAFDAYTGAVLWRVGGKPRAQTLEENATFAGAPTPDGDRLYVGAVRQVLPTDPFEHHVLCLEASTGKILWSSFVASGGTEINLFGNPTRESLGSPVSVSGDSVFYVTNHGAAAALDKRSGRVRWTYRYRQVRINPTRSVYVHKNPLQWVNSPPLLAEGVAVVTPTDSEYLFALDAGTGELRWKVGRSDHRYVYGARGGTLALGGERLELRDLKTGKLAAPPVGDELSGTGRGVVAEDGIYVPGRDRLRKVRWDGSWDEAHSKPWPPGTVEGGNLLVVDGAVVLATQDAVKVCFDRRDQEQAIRAELEKHPDDPAVLYRGALRFLQSGAPGEAARLFARVAERTLKSARPEDERLGRAARKRLYAVSMSMARTDLDAGKPEAAAGRLRAALESAPDPASRVEAALLLGRIHLALKDAPKAIAEYQRLLQDQGDEVVGGVKVSELARDAVAEALRRAGAEVYAPWEEEARRKLEAARREGSADALAAVFRGYPNSRAAEAALIEAAAVNGRLGRADEEVALLRQFLREFPASGQGPEAQAALVRALEKKGYHASARAFLRRLARLPAEVQVGGDDGARIAAREFAERRLKSPAYAPGSSTAPLPAFSPPLTKIFQYTESVAREGAPLRAAGKPPPGTAQLLLMNYGDAVKALDVGGKRGEAWRYGLGSGLRFATWIEDGLLLAEERSVACLDPQDGSVKWRFESRTPMRGFALSGPMLYYLSIDPVNANASAVGALDAQRGVAAWWQTFEGVASSRVHAAGETVVFTAVSPNRIHVFEADTGRRLQSAASYSAGLTAQVVHATDDLLVLHSEQRFLEGYELPSGTLKWRVSLDRSTTRAVEAGASGMVILGSRRTGPAAREEVFLAVVDYRTGKIVRMQERLEVADPRFLMLEGDTAYILSRDPDRSIRLFCVGLEDLAVRWGANLGEKEATLLPPALAKEHLLVVTFESGAENKYAYGGLLLDKAGRVVQNIKSGFLFERPPTYGVANDQLIFSVDTKVDVHR